jgi:hypothetical protein
MKSKGEVVVAVTWKVLIGECNRKGDRKKWFMDKDLNALL